MYYILFVLSSLNCHSTFPFSSIILEFLQIFEIIQISLLSNFFLFLMSCCNAFENKIHNHMADTYWYIVSETIITLVTARVQLQNMNTNMK